MCEYQINTYTSASSKFGFDVGSEKQPLPIYNGTPRGMIGRVHRHAIKQDFHMKETLLKARGGQIKPDLTVGNTLPTTLLTPRCMSVTVHIILFFVIVVENMQLNTDEQNIFKT